MTRGGWLLGPVILGAGVFGAGIGGCPVAAPIAAQHLGPEGLGLANSGGDAAVSTAFAGWSPAAALAARKPGIEPGGFFGGPAAGGLGERGAAIGAEPSSLLGEAAETLLAVLIRLPDSDAVPMRPMAEDLRRLPGGAEGVADALVITSSRAADETAIPRNGADPLVEYAVPALAAASLPAAGLLFLGLVRRHRRAALARRIRSAAARNGLRPARGPTG